MIKLSKQDFIDQLKLKYQTAEKAFQSIDQQKAGFLTFSDFKSELENAFKITDEESQRELFSSFPLNSEQQITYEEWTTVFKDESKSEAQQSMKGSLMESVQQQMNLQEQGLKPVQGIMTPSHSMFMGKKLQDSGFSPFATGRQKGEAEDNGNTPKNEKQSFLKQSGFDGKRSMQQENEKQQEQQEEEEKIKRKKQNLNDFFTQKQDKNQEKEEEEDEENQEDLKATNADQIKHLKDEIMGIFQLPASPIKQSIENFRQKKIRSPQQSDTLLVDLFGAMQKPQSTQVYDIAKQLKNCENLQQLAQKYNTTKPPNSGIVLTSLNLQLSHIKNSPERQLISNQSFYDSPSQEFARFSSQKKKTGARASDNSSNFINEIYHTPHSKSSFRMQKLGISGSSHSRPLHTHAHTLAEQQLQQVQVLQNSFLNRSSQRKNWQQSSQPNRLSQSPQRYRSSNNSSSGSPHRIVMTQDSMFNANIFEISQQRHFSSTLGGGSARKKEGNQSIIQGRTIEIANIGKKKDEQIKQYFRATSPQEKSQVVDEIAPKKSNIKEKMEYFALPISWTLNLERPSNRSPLESGSLERTQRSNNQYSQIDAQDGERFVLNPSLKKEKVGQFKSYLNKIWTSPDARFNHNSNIINNNNNNFRSLSPEPLTLNYGNSRVKKGSQALQKQRENKRTSNPKQRPNHLSSLDVNSLYQVKLNSRKNSNSLNSANVLHFKNQMDHFNMANFGTTNTFETLQQQQSSKGLSNFQIINPKKQQTSSSSLLKNKSYSQKKLLGSSGGCGNNSSSALLFSKKANFTSGGGDLPLSSTISHFQKPQSFQQQFDNRNVTSTHSKLMNSNSLLTSKIPRKTYNLCEIEDDFLSSSRRTDSPSKIKFAATFKVQTKNLSKYERNINEQRNKSYYNYLNMRSISPKKLRLFEDD